MEKIIMLGTGHGFVWDLYNTCFLLENGNRNLYFGIIVDFKKNVWII